MNPFSNMAGFQRQGAGIFSDRIHRAARMPFAHQYGQPHCDRHRPKAGNETPGICRSHPALLLLL